MLQGTQGFLLLPRGVFFLGSIDCCKCGKNLRIILLVGGETKAVPVHFLRDLRERGWGWGVNAMEKLLSSIIRWPGYTFRDLLLSWATLVVTVDTRRSPYST